MRGVRPAAFDTAWMGPPPAVGIPARDVRGPVRHGRKREGRAATGKTRVRASFRLPPGEGDQALSERFLSTMPMMMIRKARRRSP